MKCITLATSKLLSRARAESSSFPSSVSHVRALHSATRDPDVSQAGVWGFNPILPLAANGTLCNTSFTTQSHSNILLRNKHELCTLFPDLTVFARASLSTHSVARV
ncbi:hypothetical protein QCA50_013572 [Cerrena zonata]|uniref:Secreted protein n=1 Tax=Cerrena zonata TaxID=2478898 RepID=A0AAW0FPV7_9APHY